MTPSEDRPEGNRIDFGSEEDVTLYRIGADTNLYREGDWLINCDTGEKTFSPLGQRQGIDPAVVGLAIMLVYGIIIGFLLGWWLM